MVARDFLKKCGAGKSMKNSGEVPTIPIAGKVGG
jgi:hypothetical protein